MRSGGMPASSQALICRQASQHPGADRDDQAGFFGDGDEASGGISPSSGGFQRSSASTPDDRVPSAVSCGW